MPGVWGTGVEEMRTITILGETWTHETMGWYTHPTQGGICLEIDGRWHWHSYCKSGSSFSARTAREVMTHAAEVLHARQGGGK
jgi:hypothetical protein